MQIEYWPIDPELQREAEDNYRTNFALKLKDRDALTIIRELTFDGITPKMEIEHIERLFRYVEKNILKRPIAGVGLEVGAGPLTFSSILSKRSGVKKMYGVEICRPIVDVLFPKVAEYILGEKRDKVIGVVGSFDEMQLPDASVDFVFDFFSLHHSLDINVTLRECYRILKPGGFVLCFDKARPDHYTDQDLNELLDAVYDSSYNRQFGLPEEQKINRRSNGEREYRRKDWQAAFLGAGFGSFEHAYLARTKSGNRLSQLFKRGMSVLPAPIQKIINPLLPHPTFNHKFILSSEDRIFAPPINYFAKEISLLIAYK